MDVFNLHTMKKEESISSPLSVALGNFDGVHIGHADLITRAAAYAKAHNISSAVWTFSDGTDALPNKPTASSITTTSQKLALIARLGVDYAILESFHAVRSLSPESFVKELLLKKCGAVCAVCGFNFRFGAGGIGNSDTLCELMKPYDCIVVPPVYHHGRLVSSTVIRQLIESGDMEAAADYLGHPFFIDSPVVHGKQLGRTIGIPTINQYFVRGHVIPRAGIYACLVEFEGKVFPGVANIGIRPTIVEDDHLMNCETHIINYNGWLYGKNAKVSFYKRLRDERRFDGIEELKRQIESDVEATCDYFADKV